MPALRTIGEMPTLQEDARLARGAALLILQEVGDNPCPDPYEIEDVMDSLNRAHRITIVACDEDERVLAVGGLEHNGSEGEIMDIATAPNQRQRGLGRSVVGLLEKIAKNAGVKKVTLFPLDGARVFWQKLDYQERGPHIYFKLLQD